MTATIVPTAVDNLEMLVAEYASRFQRGPEPICTGDRTATGTNSGEARNVMNRHHEATGGFASVYELRFEAGSTFVACDATGGEWLARWAADAGIDFEEMYRTAGMVDRYYSPEFIGCREDGVIPWSSATAAARGLQPPPLNLELANNQNISRPIRFAGATA